MEHRSTEEILRLIAEGTASATGEEFFRALVKSLAAVWGAKYAFVAEYGFDPKRARMLALYADGDVKADIEYELRGTPCENVVQGSPVYVPRDVQTLYPDEPDARELGIESYAAIPIKNDAGEVVGHIGVYDDRPMPEEPPDFSIFKIFGARFQAEQERIRAEHELHAAQAQLLESCKIAVTGQLTSGILHELNTPVGVVRSSLDVIERCVSKLERRLAHANEGERSSPPSVAESLEVLQALRDSVRGSQLAADRITKLAERLQRFARIDEAEHKLTDLNECFESAVDMLNGRLQGSVTLVRELTNLPRIEGNPGELNQAFMAILTNAIDAVRGVGAITATSWTERGCVLLQITDDGRGMTREELASLFDIRLRSQGSRVGIGTGMAGVQAIVEHHGGQVTVDSKVGEGTIVTVSIPENAHPSFN